MNLRYLQYLRLVIEHGSFAAAGRAGGVSQPAISHGLRQLQKAFGGALLVRQGRRSVPTELALHVAAEGASFAQRVDALGDAPPRRAAPDLLRVGLTPSAALVCGPLLHDGWCAGHPRRRLEMASADEGSLLAGLRRRSFDLVIAPRPRGPLAEGLSCQGLYRLQPLAYARRAHPLAGARTLEQLAGAAWAAVGPSVRGPVDVLSEAFAVRRMKPPHVAVSCPDYASMVGLVARSDLLAVLPHPALLGEAARLVTALRLREALPLYEMCLFQQAASRRPFGALVQRLAAELQRAGVTAAGVPP